MGRRLFPSNKLFGLWCGEHGFDMAPPVRSDAMWYASSYNDCKTAPEDMSHPTNLRQWHRENAPADAPSVALQITPEDAPRPRLTIKAAQKINKLAALAERGEGGEKETEGSNMRISYTGWIPCYP